MRTPVFFLSLLVAALGAHADVVRCTDTNGGIVYTDGPCPAGSRLSRQVPIMESPPPDETRRPDVTPPQSAPVASPVPGNAQQPGLTVIPRSVSEQPAATPDPVYILGPGPYDGGGRPIYRPRPHPSDPPPGRRPCPNLAGIQRNNC